MATGHTLFATVGGLLCKSDKPSIIIIIIITGHTNTNVPQRARHAWEQPLKAVQGGLSSIRSRC